VADCAFLFPDKALKGWKNKTIELSKLNKKSDKSDDKSARDIQDDKVDALFTSSIDMDIDKEFDNIDLDIDIDFNNIQVNIT